MHWLMILGLLTATTDLQDQSASNSALGRMAETAIRQQLGGDIDEVKVDLKRGTGSAGNFDYFNISLRGFDADRFQQLQSGARSAQPQKPAQKNFTVDDIFGGIFNGDIGSILGGILLNKNGRIGKMQIHAGDFRYEDVRYDALSADLGGIEFDWGKSLRNANLEVKTMRAGTLGVRLNAEQVTRLVAPRLPSVRGAKLRFQQGQTSLSGRAVFYGAQVPFEVGGRLQVRTNQVRADDLRLKIARLQLPAFVTNEITRGVNPLYDFDPDQKWPVAVNLDTADSNRDLLTMRGGLQWLGFKRDKKRSGS